MFQAHAAKVAGERAREREGGGARAREHAREGEGARAREIETTTTTTTRTTKKKLLGCLRVPELTKYRRGRGGSYHVREVPFRHGTEALLQVFRQLSIVMLFVPDSTQQVLTWRRRQTTLSTAIANVTFSFSPYAVR